MTDELMKVLSENIYGVWFLIGAALVFWMQASFWESRTTRRRPRQRETRLCA